MSEETALLAELMLHSDVFCTAVEAEGARRLPPDKVDPIRLKISQSRGILAHLQKEYDDDRLTISDPAICADFRSLIMSLLWVNFLAQELIDQKMFRKLVLIESSFTYLLIARLKRRGRHL